MIYTGRLIRTIGVQPFHCTRAKEFQQLGFERSRSRGKGSRLPATAAFLTLLLSLLYVWASSRCYHPFTAALKSLSWETQQIRFPRLLSRFCCPLPCHVCLSSSILAEQNTRRGDRPSPHPPNDRCFVIQQTPVSALQYGRPRGYSKRIGRAASSKKP